MHRIHDTLIYWDHICWYYLNTQWHTPFLDSIIPFFRNQWFWTPLYLFLAIFIPLKFSKRGLVWCLLFILCFVISDQVSATLMKPYFHRLRPCHNPYLSSIIHQLVPCGGQYGFPSSHASNHFSVGIFSAVTLGRLAKWVWPVAILWALLVSFSQVYVGVHYPLDVTCGALLGTIVGVLVGKVHNRYFDLREREVVALQA